MSATFQWGEDNGAATGSPAHGTTSTLGRAESNWKNIDDSTTAYSAQPIAAGSNSYEKWIYGKFTGAFNTISNCLFAHTAGAMGTGVTIKATVTSSYTTPATATNAALTTDTTAVIAIGSGLAVLFSTVGPQGASPTSTLTATGFTQYCVNQLQTTVSAVAGDTATATWTIQYAES